MNDILQHKNRAHARVECNVPTKFFHSSANQCFDLNIRNISRGGLYFEAFQRLAQKSKIDIYIGDNVFSPELLEEVKHYSAQVKWMKKIHTCPLYGAGAQILEKSDSIDENTARELLRLSGLDCKYRLYNQVCEADACVYLLEPWFRIFPDLPDGIKKYLIGNIY